MIDPRLGWLLGHLDLTHLDTYPERTPLLPAFDSEKLRFGQDVMIDAFTVATGASRGKQPTVRQAFHSKRYIRRKTETFWSILRFIHSVLSVPIIIKWRQQDPLPTWETANTG
jgi:hypothetical protein